MAYDTIMRRVATIVINEKITRNDGSVMHLVVEVASGFSIANLSYSLLDKGEHLECRMTVRTTDKKEL